MAGKKRNPSDDVPVFATGDVNPFDHGGGIVYYQPEYDEFVWVFWDYIEDTEDDHHVQMFRFRPEGDIFHQELSWMTLDDSEVESVADSVGMSERDLRALGRGNFIEKLQAAEIASGYWGLDDEPERLTSAQLKRRYERDHDQAKRIRGEEALRRVEQLRQRADRDPFGRLLRAGRSRKQNPSHRSKNREENPPIRKLKNRLMR